MKTRLAIKLAAPMLALWFMACGNPVIESLAPISPPLVESGTPYADKETLDAIAANSSTYVDWRLSRVFAVIEKETVDIEGDWSNTKLSERPVLIYDSQNNPKYYEFRVIKDGKEIGAISCNAVKANGKPVQFIMSSAPNYASVSPRSLQNLRIVDHGYPASVYQGAVNARGDIETPEAPSSPANLTGGDINVLEFLKNSNQETLRQMGISEEIYAQLLEKATADQAALSELWERIEAKKSAILATSDTQLESAPRALSRGNWAGTWLAQPWWNSARWYNPGRWCGPNAMAFIAYGGGYWCGSPYPGGNNKAAID